MKKKAGFIIIDTSHLPQKTTLNPYVFLFFICCHI